MRSWAILLGGLLVWALHFFLLYGIGEFAGEGPAARGAVLLLTMVALAADVFLARRLYALPASDAFACWRARLALGAVALSAIAIFWQALPAVLAA